MITSSPLHARARAIPRQRAVFPCPVSYCKNNLLDFSFLMQNLKHKCCKGSKLEIPCESNIDFSMVVSSLRRWGSGKSISGFCYFRSFTAFLNASAGPIVMTEGRLLSIVKVSTPPLTRPSAVNLSKSEIFFSWISLKALSTIRVAWLRSPKYSYAISLVSSEMT